MKMQFHALLRSKQTIALSSKQKNSNNKNVENLIPLRNGLLASRQNRVNGRMCEVFEILHYQLQRNNQLL